MKRQTHFACGIVLIVGAITLITGNAADARPIGGASPHMTMNSPRLAPRTNLELPQKAAVRDNGRVNCVLKSVPRALAAGYSDRPRGHHGHGRQYYRGNGGEVVYEQKLVCE